MGAMTPIRRALMLPAIALLLVACTSGGAGPSGAASPTPDTGLASAPAPTAAPASDAPSATDAPDAGSPAAPTPDPTTAPPVLDQAWATTELTDVATGETFRLADLAGRTVILETMAIWCTNCLRQQGHVYEALEQLDPDRVAYVLIDVDPNETPAALAQYRDRNGFTGIYAVADRDLARALAAEFGDQVLNPPSTPMIVIGSDGRVTLTPFGQKSPDEIVAIAQEHGA
jgi:thiol-disulfide isomerase/thioredoxin